MRLTLLIIPFLCLAFNGQAQERFFTFLPGWTAIKPFETANGYTVFGLNVSDSTAFYSISDLELNGALISNNDFFFPSSNLSQSQASADFQRSDENYVITGLRRSLGSEAAEGVLFQLDPILNQPIEVNYFELGNGQETWLRSCLPQNDGSTVVGSIFRVQQFEDVAALLKVNSSGNIIWQTEFSCGTDCNPFPQHILSLSDGGYIFTLQEEYLCPTLAIEDIRSTLIRTDSQGNEIWRIWPGTDLGTYRSGPWTVQTSDGNLLFAYTDRYTNECLPQGNDTNTVRFAKIDLESGEMIWEKDVRQALPTTPNDSITGYAYDITQLEMLSDGNILLVGTNGIWGLSIKVTENAEHIWHRAYLPIGNSLQTDPGYGQKMEILGFSETSDGGFIMAGEYVADPGITYPSGLQSAFALKVDEYGCLEPDCQLADTLGTGITDLLSPTRQIKTYPNPATDVLNIEVSDNGFEIQEVRITDMLGRATKPIPLQKGVSQSVQQSGRGISSAYDIQSLPTGIYILTVQFEDGTTSSLKFVKE